MLVFFLLLIFTAPAYARDWYEPVEVLNPLLFRTYTEPEFMAGGYAETAFVNQEFHAAPYDAFQLHLRAGHTLFAAPRLATSLTYAAYVMNGPVIEGRKAGSRLQWLMNAVQFEYGLHLAYDTGVLFVLAEYSRTSQHPFNEKFSQVASDLLKAGVAAPALHIGSIRLHVLMRVGYAEIFDFWKSTIEEPRSAWLMQPTISAEWQGITLTPWLHLAAFATANAELALARTARYHTAGEFVGNTALAGGIRLRGHKDSTNSFDFSIDYYGSDNSEIRADRKTPAHLLSYGIHFRVFY